jgi:hypothetical protein
MQKRLPIAWLMIMRPSLSPHHLCGKCWRRGWLDYTGVTSHTHRARTHSKEFLHIVRFSYLRCSLTSREWETGRQTQTNSSKSKDSSHRTFCADKSTEAPDRPDGSRFIPHTLHRLVQRW